MAADGKVGNAGLISNEYKDVYFEAEGETVYGLPQVKMLELATSMVPCFHRSNPVC